MVVMILEKVPPGLRGELSRWLLEPKAGIFVGKVSGLVRDKLWEMCVGRRGANGIMQIWSAANEQGFEVRTFGTTKRSILDREGLWIVRKPRTPDKPSDPKLALDDETPPEHFDS